MKQAFTLFTILFSSLFIAAQNVGIGTLNPLEKLNVKGNLFVQQDAVQSSSEPDAANTFSLTGNTVLSVFDSVYRFYDPGGTGNYSPNTTVSLSMIDSGFYTGSQIGGLEISFDLIDLGAGDSILIYDMFSIRPILLCGGNCNTPPYPRFSGVALGVEFRSNSDGSVGQGFSMTVRRLFPQAPSSQSNSQAKFYANSSLLFDAGKGSLKAGFGPHDDLGLAAISLGLGTVAKGRGSIAIGYGSKANSLYDVALGRGVAEGGDAFSLGGNATSPNSVAIGYTSTASSTGAMSLGYQSNATGPNSVAIGLQSRSDGPKSFALGGGQTNSNSINSLAFGELSSASGNYSIAMGKSATANGVSAIAIGENSTATGDNAIALGRFAQVLGGGGMALGRNAIANPTNTAIGASSAFGTNTFAIGNSANSSASNSIAIGNNSSASANNSFAIGNNVNATGNYSIALGNYVSTSGFEGALTIGDRSTTTVMNTFVDNGMRCRFANGYRFFTNSAANIGAFLNANANSWAALSDVRLKENFLPVEGEMILKKIAAMPQYTWNYKGQDVKTLRHYGPMAQDFYNAFGKDGLGEIGCDTLINQQDFLGVNFVAIQALEKRTQDLQKENNLLRKQNQELEARLLKLEKALSVKQE